MKSALTSLALFVSAVMISGCGRPFTVATPPGFVDLGKRYGSDEYRATTADGVVLGVRAFDNDPEGESAFWERAIEHRMRDMGGYALLEKHQVKNRAGQLGTELRFGHDEGTQPNQYILALFVTKKKIFIVEAGGPKPEVERVMPQIEWSMQNFFPH